MTPTLTFRRRPEVEAALTDPALVPPEAPPSLGSGATAALRAAMARFSSGDAHRHRRGDVVRAIDALVPGRLRSAAADRAAARLTGARVDAVADLAYRVPVEVLAGALGVGRHPVGLVADVRQLAETIGRGAPATAASDAAATRVLAHVEHHPAGPVAAASVLYQAHDAAAALLTTTIVGRHERAPRRSAVVRTLRSAATDTDVAGTPVAAGALVALDLDATGLELGAGPHRCPGREVAEAIVAGVLDALDDRGYALLAGLVVLDEGRPLALPMEPRR